MMRARLHILGLAGAALALAACASEDKPGIEVSVDLAGLPVRSLKIAISADMGGFMTIPPGGNVQHIPVSTEDFDGDGNIDFVTVFANPTGPISFRVQTDNMVDLQVAGHALGFDDTKLIGSADTAWTTLPAGGRASIAIKLEANGGGVVGPDTQSTDVKTASPSITVTPGMAAGFSSVAVCNLDGDDKPDLVIGAPQAHYLDQPVGAVYVLLGKNGFPGAIDLSAGSWMGFTIFGQYATDQLGYAVACADLDNDTYDDLVMGAPGANNAAGEVYVVFGSQGIAGRAITIGSASNAPDITFQANLQKESGFGGKLLARDLDGDRKAEILVGPQTSSGIVHLFRYLPVLRGGPVSVDNPDHVTFTGYNVSSIAAGNLRRVPGGVDVVIGDTEARMPGTTAKVGAVYAFPEVDPAGSTLYDAASPPTGTTIYGNEGSQFGAATLAIDTTGEGEDLIIGAPGDNQGAGAFYVFKGDSESFFLLPVRPLSEKSAWKDGPSANGRFGAALAGTPSGTTSLSWGLLVGAPGTARTSDRPLAGAAYLFGGRAGWPFPLYEEVFGAAIGDALGSMVAGGQVDGDHVGDLVTIAPGGGASHDGAVYIQYNHVLVR